MSVAWSEEVLAGVARKVPYNVEQDMKQRGALYEKAQLPFVSHIVTPAAPRRPRRRLSSN